MKQKRKQAQHEMRMLCHIVKECLNDVKTATDYSSVVDAIHEAKLHLNTIEKRAEQAFSTLGKWEAA